MNNMGLSCTRSTYMRIFFNTEYYSVKRSAVDWIRGCGPLDTEGRLYSHVDFQLHKGSAPLIPASFKGQLQISRGDVMYSMVTIVNDIVL